MSNETDNMKRFDQELATLIANQKAAPDDKKSSFNSDITSKRVKLLAEYEKYMKKLYEKEQGHSVKPLKDILGHEPY
jgi:hypothetical protein